MLDLWLGASQKNWDLLQNISYLALSTCGEESHCFSVPYPKCGPRKGRGLSISFFRIFKGFRESPSGFLHTGHACTGSLFVWSGFAGEPLGKPTILGGPTLKAHIHAFWFHAHRWISWCGLGFRNHPQLDVRFAKLVVSHLGYNPLMTG